MATNDLVARLGLDQSDFETGLAKAKTGVKEFAGALSGMKGALTAAFAGAVVKHLAEDVLETASNLSRLSKQTGIGVEELQRLDHVAKKSGTDLNAMSDAFSKLAIAMGKALKGDVDTREAFEDLGITIKDIQSLSPEELFIKMADAVKDSNDPVRTAGDLTAILGRNYRDMLPLLTKGTSEINRLKKETDGVIPKEVLDNIRELKKDLTETGEISLDGIKYAIAQILSFTNQLLKLLRLVTLELVAIGNKYNPLQKLLLSKAGITQEGIEGAIKSIATQKPKEDKSTPIDRFVEATEKERKAGEDEEKRNIRVVELSLANAKMKEELARSQLTTEQQIAELEQKRAEILANSDQFDNDEQRLANEREVLEIDKDLLSLRKKMSEESEKETQDRLKAFGKEVQQRDEQLRHLDELKEGKGVSVAAPITDTLARIGGFVGGSNNNFLRVSEKHLKVAENMREYLREINQKLDPYGGDSDAVTAN